jgi:acyl carrier protein
MAALVSPGDGGAGSGDLVCFRTFWPILEADIDGNRLRGRAMTETQAMVTRIKHLLVEALHLEGVDPSKIANDAPLFGEGLGLDSVDALELVVALEKEFGIRIENHEVGKEAFASIGTLAAFVDQRLAAARKINAGS